MKQKMKFAFHVLTHPFDGFWDMRHENKGSLLLSLIFILMWIVANIFTKEVTGFLFNESALQLTNVLTEIQRVIIGFLLFTIGNWSITTLMDGEGRFKDIVMVFGYASLPLSLITIPLSFLSLVFSYSESVYYVSLTVISGIWFFFLLFTGLMTVHQYSVFKMVITTILTILAMLALVFIFLLFFELISQFVVFITAIYQEMSYRL